jgi:hypothetical protein
VNVEISSPTTLAKFLPSNSYSSNFSSTTTLNPNFFPMTLVASQVKIAVIILGTGSSPNFRPSTDLFTLTPLAKSFPISMEASHNFFATPFFLYSGKVPTNMNSNRQSTPHLSKKLYKLSTSAINLTIAFARFCFQELTKLANAVSSFT